jgi:hypothetical protein
MGNGRRNRRPGGHPARAAARREREAARRLAGKDQTAAVARRLVRDAAGCEGPLDAELWASHMLGTMWEQRTGLPLDEAEDYALIYGQPLMEAIARTGGLGARIALTAMAAVDDGELGLVSRRLADGLPRLGSEPSWLPCLGETTILSAAVMREDVFDDGFTMFLEARHATGDTHVVGVYVDNNLGMMAKDILLTGSIDRVAEVIRETAADDDGEVRLDPIRPAQAAAEIVAAMELTEITLDAPVSEDYAALRALARLRADEVPGVALVAERQEMSVAERDSLHDEFLSAPEARGFAADGDEAFAASLAIDFCANYADGCPLRWSPVLVEMFMSDWVPRKVLAHDGFLAALPGALDAWVRFAGRKRGIPEWAIEVTREMILLCGNEMSEAGSDPTSAGPGKQFLMAAQQAGVDVTDEAALAVFTAGWNARSISA